MDEILLHIKGSRSPSNHEEVDFITQGTLETEADGYILKYSEHEEPGEEGVFTEIRIQGGAILLRQTGDPDTFFVFERSKTFQTTYYTPLGNIDLCLLPTLVDTKLSPDAGKIELEYILNVGGSQIVNRLNLDYTKKA